MKKLAVALMLLLVSTIAAMAGTCPAETSEKRVTEAITADDNYFVVTGEDLDLFIKNANLLYNIGWVRKQIARVYVIDAPDVDVPDERYQPVHLFFIDTDGCIVYYQATYKIVVKQLLDPDPTSHRVPVGQ